MRDPRDYRSRRPMSPPRTRRCPAFLFADPELMPVQQHFNCLHLHKPEQGVSVQQAATSLPIRGICLLVSILHQLSYLCL